MIRVLMVYTWIEVLARPLPYWPVRTISVPARRAVYLQQKGQGQGFSKYHTTLICSKQQQQKSRFLYIEDKRKGSNLCYIVNLLYDSPTHIKVSFKTFTPGFETRIFQLMWKYLHFSKHLYIFQLLCIG